MERLSGRERAASASRRTLICRFPVDFLCGLLLLFVLPLAGCAGGPPDAVAAPGAIVPAGESFVGRDGFVHPIRVSLPAAAPRAVLVAVHGFNDYRRFIDDAASHFAAAGIKTITYDQRGFGGTAGRGRWAGAAALSADFLFFLRHVRNTHPGLPLFVLGESMGGAVVAVALSSAPDIAVDGVVLVSPAIWARDSMPWYQRFGLWAGANLVPAMTISGRRFAILPSDNVPMREALAKDPLVIQSSRLDTLDGLSDLMDLARPAVPWLRPRTLLLYGLRDVMIPRRPMIALFEQWPADAGQNFRFALYPDGHHMLLRDLQGPRVRDDVLSWLLRPEAPLPSGFERQRQEILPLLRADSD